MAEQDINIRLSLKDEFSSAIAKVTERIEDIGKTVERTGKEINAMGSKLTMLGGIITGGFTVALKQVSEYSPEVNRVFQDMGNSFLKLESIIAAAVLPIFREISNVISRVTDAFASMDPELRKTILNILLITGIILTFGGIALKIIGSVIYIFGNLLQAINPVTLAIAAVAGAVLLMVLNWDSVSQYVLPVINSLQIGADMVAIGWNKVAVAMAHVQAFIAAMAFKQDLAVGFETQVIELEKTIQGLEDDMTKVMSGQGSWASAVDDGIERVRTFMDQMKNLFTTTTQSTTNDIKNFIDEFTKTFDQALVKVQNLGQQSAQIVINTVQQLSNGFGNAVGQMIVKGKNFGESMKAVAEQMAISFISSIVSMIAQWIIFQVIQAAFMPMMVAMGTSAAGALAAIWAPVAAMVSLATMGGNAGPAAAAIVSTTALAIAMAIPKLGEGAIVTRPTFALIGERGPEAVVPLNRSNYRTTNIHIEVNNPNISSREDIDTLTEEISRRFMREIDRIR